MESAASTMASKKAMRTAKFKTLAEAIATVHVALDDLAELLDVRESVWLKGLDRALDEFERFVLTQSAKEGRS